MNWFFHLFIIAKRMNSILDLFSSNRNGCRKPPFITTFNFDLLHDLT